jgi:hypothetical protein
MASDKDIKIEFAFTVHQLKVLLESTNYFLDALEDDEEAEFVADKYDVAEINKLLERLVANDR